MTDQKAPWCSLMIALVAIASAYPAADVRAQGIDNRKAIKVKAAYLYNFAKFIEWPDGAFADEKTPFVIGVLGDDPFGRILDATVKAKEIAKRAVKIRRLSWSKQSDRARLKDCHILYVSNSERRRLKKLIAALQGQPVLLVADITGFADGGGMIGFVLEKQRIIFEINREALGQAKLKASATLLKLARIVKPRDRRLKKSRTTGGRSG